MQNPNAITIVNAHWNNRGDEAALLAVVEGVREKYHHSMITIIFKDDHAIDQFPQLENVAYFSAKFKAKIWDIWLTTLTHGILGINQALKKTVRELVNSDLIIYSPGGSVINDRFWWIKQMEYLVPFICAKFYRIPLFIAAPSIGPFDEKKPNTIRKWLLKTPRIMCVREEISRKYLAGIGITKNVHVTIDSAFLNIVDQATNQSKLEAYKELDAFINSRAKVVGITITDFSWHVKYHNDSALLARIEESFRKFINKLSDQDYGILFIPQLFGNQNDFEYMDKYSGPTTFTMDDTHDANFQQYVISKLYAVIGMRYHSNIFAAKMGTPFLAVAYEEKMQGFMELADLAEYSIPLQDISYEALLGKYELLESNHSAFRKKLEMSIPEWRKKAEHTIELMAQG